MLTALLPGLRELRTPLAVGYLWLLLLYLATRDAIPDAANAKGIWAAVYELIDLLGAGVGLAALTFTAYLLGSLLSGIDLLSPARVVARLVRKRHGDDLSATTLLLLPPGPSHAGHRNLDSYIARQMPRIAREANGIWIQNWPKR